MSVVIALHERYGEENESRTIYLNPAVISRIRGHYNGGSQIDILDDRSYIVCQETPFQVATLIGLVNVENVASEEQV